MNIQPFSSLIRLSHALPKGITAKQAWMGPQEVTESNRLIKAGER